MDEKAAVPSDDAPSPDEMNELIKAQYESLEVEGISSCTHISKAVDPKAVKLARKISHTALALCDVCCKVGDGRMRKVDSEDPSSGYVTKNGKVGLTDDIWVCMCCAITSCGRNFGHLHAANHARHKVHPIAVQPFKRWVWCYICDDFVSPDAAPKLVDILKQLTPHLDKHVKRYEERTGEKSMPPPGLSNLGNTCFYNSAIQNVLHTHVLVALIRHLQTDAADERYNLTLSPSPQPVLNHDGSHKSNVEYPPMSISLSDYEGEIAHELANLVVTYHQGGGVVKPSRLFNVIVMQVPRFRGYQQQDSHELLRYLIDGMRTYRHEELRKTIAAKLAHPYPWPKTMKVGALETIMYTFQETPETRAMKEKSRAYFHSANVTPIDRVFGGTLLQTIQCTVCRHISTRIEPFLDLSLSICDKQRVAEKERQLPSLDSPAVITCQPGDEPMVEAANTSIESINIDEDDDGGRRAGRKVYGSMSLEDDYQEGLQRLLERLAPAIDNKDECSLGTCLDAFTQRELLQGDNKFGCTNCFNKEKMLLEKSSHTIDNCCPGSPTPSSSSEVEEEVEESERRFTRNNPAPIAPSKGAKTSNKYKYVEAVKRYIIIRPPPVLAVHLKRFIKRGWSYSKNSADVKFPAKFNLAPWMCKFSEVCSVRARTMDTSAAGIAHVLRFVDLAKRGDGNRCEVDRHMLTAMLNRHVGTGTSETTTELAGTWYSISDSHASTTTLERVLRNEAYVLFYERVL